MTPPLPPRLVRRFRAVVAVPPARRAAILIIVAAVMVAVGLARVVHRHQVVKLGYELSRATARLAELREERRRLDLETSLLVSPERIRTLATSLGMIAPPPDQILRIAASPLEAP